MKPRRSITAPLIATAFAAAVGVYALTPYRMNVDRVIDGDTVQADLHLGFGVWLNDQRIRLEGIDCPELREKGGVEARTYTEVWLRSADERYTGDKRDSFGRLLGTITDTATGETLNQALLDSGHAKPY